MPDFDPATRCPSRYAGSPPAEASPAVLECREYHRHHPPHVIVTDPGAAAEADREWDAELYRIAALPFDQMCTQVTTHRIRPDDQARISGYAAQIGRQAAAMAFLLSR